MGTVKGSTIITRSLCRVVPGKYDVGDLQFICLCNEVAECVQGILEWHPIEWTKIRCQNTRDFERMDESLPHVVITTTWTEFHSNSIGAEDVNYSFEDLKTQSCPIFNTSTPLVGPLIGCVIKELMDHVSIRGMHLVMTSLVNRILV